MSTRALFLTARAPSRVKVEVLVREGKQKLQSAALPLSKCRIVRE